MTLLEGCLVGWLVGALIGLLFFEPIIHIIDRNRSKRRRPWE